MVAQLVVGDARLASVVRTLYHGRRDDGVHRGAGDVEATATEVALPTFLAGEAASASQMPALALHRIAWNLYRWNDIIDRIERKKEPIQRNLEDRRLKGAGADGT